MVTRVLERKKAKRPLADVPQAYLCIDPASVRVNQSFEGGTDKNDPSIAKVFDSVWRITVDFKGPPPEFPKTVFTLLETKMKRYFFPN